MLTHAQLQAFAATSRADESLLFYRDTLGLSVVEDTDFATVYDANGTILRLQKVAAVVPVPYTVLGWTVRDLAACIAALQAKGVSPEFYDGLPQDERGVWTLPDGTAILWFKDIDGNTLSLTQVG